MRFRDIIEALREDVMLPIAPERIAGIIRTGGTITQVVYVGVDMDVAILRGKFVRIHYEDAPHLGPVPPPYSIPDNGMVAKVYYERNQSPEEIRLVINKELLHAVDPDHVRTATPAQVTSLVNKLRLPLDMILALDKDFNREAFVDFLTDLRAVAAMVPEKIRQLIVDKYAEGKIDEAEIATLTGIPQRYMSSLLSEHWPRMMSFWLRDPM
jgi:hypothetical protein